MFLWLFCGFEFEFRGFEFETRGFGNGERLKWILNECLVVRICVWFCLRGFVKQMQICFMRQLGHYKFVL